MQAYSAPGKAFLAGGYLVLEERFSACVTALSSRMHAVIDAKPASSSHSTVTVKSPQFAFSQWDYTIDDNYECTERQGLRNPFIEATVFTAVAYARSPIPHDIVITLYSDPGYHTQDDTREERTRSRAFLYHSKPIQAVEKTGLGSSAGLVTVVTAALLCYFKDASVEEIRDQIHNCAQIAHCLAQKKVGSGFDVATAVYGSIIYNRFAPLVVNELYEDPFFKEKTPDTREVFTGKLAAVVDACWKFRHESWELPPGVHLLMGDIKGGSETPKLVSKVLKWRSENPESSDVLYGLLNKANGLLVATIRSLQALHDEQQDLYYKSLETISKERSGINSNPFSKITQNLEEIRLYLRQLTEATGAEIEPPEQTQLLNACLTIEGCLGGVVPGAGGYDAICLLITEESIPSFIEKTKSDPRFAAVSWLQLQEEAAGLRSEVPESYQ